MSGKLSEYEREREANIAKNRARLEQLGLGANTPGIFTENKQPKTQAKPVQPTKKVKREKSDVVARRQSARLRGPIIDADESPSKKRKREAEEEERRAKEAEERLQAEERERIQKRPRHHDLDLPTLLDEAEDGELSELSNTLQNISPNLQSFRVGDSDAFVFNNDRRDEEAVNDLREKLQGLKVVARAKVTQDRVYSAAYHPEITKDLIFFGDKHGALGIWDARAPPDEVNDEDESEDATAVSSKEDGKYWRLQLHWPATSKSSISNIKFDPIDVHTVYTSSYDCTIRKLSFPSGVSCEVFSTDDVLVSSFDLPQGGHEMWISDALGGLTHLDLREDKSKAIRYGLSDNKIGTVSINPTSPCFLLTASNNRSLKIWDTRKLQTIAVGDLHPVSSDDAVKAPLEFDTETIEKFIGSTKGKGCLQGEWRHDKSVSSAYWDPRGRSIVSTSYDDTLRLWDISAARFAGSEPLRSFRPFSHIKHNCQTGKWVTILRARWNQNPSVYPHFTIGNMDRSLDIFSCKGDLITRLSDPKKISAVQAVTCSHPNVLERAASGNASGRCVLWAPQD